jgi:tetratricopeptide (TPR) repeat protein
MTRSAWKPCPHARADAFAGAALDKSWPRLHQGDREPFPTPAQLKKLIGAHPELAVPGPLTEAAETLQSAWRAFHRGIFAEAVELGLSLGPLGFNVANKAANIYATYLESGKKAKLAIFQGVAKRAERLQDCAPSSPNAWYFHAQALGRYAQDVSVASALAEGLGSKIKGGLERAIELEPRHADAHIALGAWHAEVIDKIGALVGGLTYGASKDAGVKHFETALKLNPHSAIARIEYADGLVMMFGNAKMAQAIRLYEQAAKIEPADAMERLDVERARAELVD